MGAFYAPFHFFFYKSVTYRTKFVFILIISLSKKRDPHIEKGTFPCVSLFALLLLDFLRLLE